MRKIVTGLLGCLSLLAVLTASGLASPDKGLSGYGPTLVGQLLFVQKGFRYSATDAFGPYDSRLTLSYLELPVLARYTFGSDTFRYFALAGPALGFKLGGKFSTEWEGEPYESRDMSHYKGMDLGLVLGGGLGYPLCSGWLLFDVRFTFGLLNIYANPDSGAAGGDTRISNTAVLFMFSYIFGGL